MMYGEDLHLIREEPIDNPVTLHNHFANVVTIDFGDYTPQPRKRRQAVRGLEYPSGE